MAGLGDSTHEDAPRAAEHAEQWDCAEDVRFRGLVVNDDSVQ